MAPAATKDNLFRSREVTDLFAVSQRQLQWWDERKVIRPTRSDARTRRYSAGEVLQIGLAAELRRRGLSLATIRKVLRSFKGAKVPRESLPDHIWLVTDGTAVMLDSDCDKLIRRMCLSTRPMLTVDLGQLMGKIRGRPAVG